MMSEVINQAAADGVLADRLRQGDEQALGDILNQFGGGLHASLASRFGRVLNDADLDEVVSCSLFRAWTCRDRYDPVKASLPTWLYVLGRSCALDLLRKQASRRQGALERQGQASLFARVQDPTSLSPDEEAAAPSSEPTTLTCLGHLLEQMPEIDRRILFAFAGSEGQGNWAATVADELGIPSSTVRSRKRRAMIRLREQLGFEGAPNEGERLMPIRIDDLADRVKHYLEQRIARAGQPGPEFAQFRAMWNAAVDDHTIEDARRRAILTETYRWLSGRETTLREYRTHIQRFLSRCFKEASLRATSLGREAPEQGVRRFEQALAGMTIDLERRMPDEVVRKGEGEVHLAWDEHDAQVRWGGRDPSISLHGAAVHSLAAHARLPGREAVLFADAVVREVANDHELNLPNFSYPPKLPRGERPLRLRWQYTKVKPDESDPPDWIRRSRLAPEGAPTDRELDLFRDDPELAHMVDRALCEAAVNELKEHPVPAGEGEASLQALAFSSVRRLVDEVALRSGWPVHEIGELFGGALRQLGAEEKGGPGGERRAALAFLRARLNEPESD